MKTILFDLDGTLLSISAEDFMKEYFTKLTAFLAHRDYDAKVIMNTILKGVQLVQANDGSKTNEDYFWEVFTQETGIPKEEIHKEFYEFYTTDFETIENEIVISDSLVEAVHLLKEKGYRLICATNPLFPDVASLARLRWSGVNTDDFDEITTYEDYHYCKPSPEYFEEIFKKFNVDKEHAIMVGNDAQEDGAAQELGLPLYLINNHLIDRSDDASKATWLGSDKEFLELVKSQF